MLRSIPDKMSSSQPRLNLNACSDTTYVKLPENLSTPFESIQQLINQIASQNIGTSESAMQNLNEILLKPDVRLLSKVIYFIVKVVFIRYRLDQCY